MAKALDLEEQEQLDQIKHFWKKYGNLISWVLIVILGGYAAWNGYQYWERTQAAKAASLFVAVFISGLNVYTLLPSVIPLTPLTPFITK